MITTCKHACDTDCGPQCTITNRACHSRRQCEIGDDYDEAQIEEQERIDEDADDE